MRYEQNLAQLVGLMTKFKNQVDELQVKNE